MADPSFLMIAIIRAITTLNSLKLRRSNSVNYQEAVSNCKITSGKENANTSAGNSQNRQLNVGNRWNAQNEAIDEKETESNKDVDLGDTVESNFVATSPLIKHICRRCQQSSLSNNSLHRHLRSDRYARSTPKESAKPPPATAPLTTERSTPERFTPTLSADAIY